MPSRVAKLSLQTSARLPARPPMPGAARRRHAAGSPALRAVALAVAALGPLAATPASAATCTWNTTGGNWAAIVNWAACATGNGNPAGAPGAADTANIGAAGVVAVTTAQSVMGLNNAGTVNITGTTLLVGAGGGSLTNSGAMNVANNSVLQLDARVAPLAIGGGGNIVLGGSTARLRVEGGTGVSLAAGSAIRGAGEIGQAVIQGGAGIFTNNGTFSADVAGGTLVLLAPGNSGSYTNNALFEARNGGTLRIDANVTQGAGGILAAEAGSFVLLAGTRINGGTLATAGTGAIRADGGANVLSNVTLAGRLDMTSIANSRETVVGGLVLNGEINIGGSGALSFNSQAGNPANQAVSGTGLVNMAGSTLRFEGTGQTTFGSGITVGGSGNIGAAAVQGGQHVLINNGLISANASGQTLQIVGIANGSQAVQNNGVLEATGGGRLLLSTDIAGAAGSQLRAGAGSTIEQNGVRITGAINTTGTGSFAANGGANVLSGVALTGVLDMTSIANSRETVVGGLVLNGSINVGSSAALSFNSQIVNPANQALSGTGFVNMAGGTLRFEGTGQTTFGSGIAVRGSGTIGTAAVQSGQHVLINDGLISANVNGQTLQIVGIANGSAAVQNNGILEATGGGRLLLSTDVANAPGSELRAGAGSTIQQNGVRITGTINTTGTGSFAANGGANVLSNVALNGVLDMTSIANSRETVVGGLALNGSINVGNGGALSFNSQAGNPLNQAVSGTGTVNLVAGTLWFEGPGQTTFGSGTTVRGSGNIGQAVVQSAQHVLVNNGLISADVSGQTLQIVGIANGSQAVQNNSILEATGGGRLLLSTDIANAPGSQLRAGAGSTIQQNGVRITGTINTTGTGTFAASGGANVLSGVTLNGVLDMTSIASSRETVVGGLVLNGSINVGNGGALSFNSQAGNPASQTLSGNGTVNLTAGTLWFEAPGQTTFGSGITVRGSGNIGQGVVQTGAHTLVNNGRLLADGGTLTIVPIANGGGVTGTGTLEVAGGTLSLATSRPTAQGTLIIGATGTLATNNQNITLSSDYTNVQAGSGNSFNRRAGITGTGLIVAGGNAAQTITGVGVTGGNTANATLTIGNVRVGSTTFNYQMANAGTTGPTLRGAIQTSVNGANLTDTRLGGVGVTPGLFNAGAPGGNSGNLGVSFSVASAGAIAPLSGQVLNLRSNFENIADQRLNIVVGSGAAAFNAAVGSATPSPVQLAAQRVGGSLSQTLTVANTAPAGAFSEDLNASFSGFTGGASGTGSISGRTAGSSSSGAGSMSVGLDTSTSGAMSGTATLAYATAGAVAGVSNGLGVAPAGTQAITVSGNVYAPAVAQLNTPNVNFGIVRVGDTVTPRNVSVSNTASGALTDTLRASLSGGASPFTASGTAASVVAGGSNNSSLSVALNTTAAGVYSSSGSVVFTSQNPEMADLPLGTSSVGFTATVNNLAGTTLAHAGAGSFSGGLLSYTLNFGTVFTGLAGGTATLSLSNSATGPADALAGTFNLAALAAGDPFALGGFTGFAGLAAGSSLTGLTVSFGGTVEGSFDRVIVLNRLSTNGSGPDLNLAPVELRLVGTVTAVPEPGTWAMWLAGLAMVGSLMRRRARAMRE